MAAPLRDPYLVLGVRPGASDDELHTAYRRLVRLHHPDHNPGDPDAARRFEEVQEAYARVRRLRADRPPKDQSPPDVAADPAVDTRVEDLERELREAQAARERAQRAAREATAAGAERPSDEELGYVTTDDSFSKILGDARSELSGWLGDPSEQPARRRVADLLDELAAKLKGDATPGSRE
jgi:curved DNA-binding protein CbpA